MKLHLVSGSQSLCCCDLMYHITPSQTDRLYREQHILQSITAMVNLVLIKYIKIKYLRWDMTSNLQSVLSEITLVMCLSTLLCVKAGLVQNHTTALPLDHL